MTGPVMTCIGAVLCQNDLLCYCTRPNVKLYTAPMWNNYGTLARLTATIFLPRSLPLAYMMESKRIKYSLCHGFLCIHIFSTRFIQEKNKNKIINRSFISSFLFFLRKFLCQCDFFSTCCPLFYTNFYLL